MNKLINKNLAKTLLKLIKYRRSVRYFNSQKVSRADIISIIEAGIWAPTGCNNQEIRFLILDREKDIQQMIKFKPFFKGVSTFVLLFCDMSLALSQKMYLETKSEKHLPYIDTGLALANMILYAKSKGIDSCIFNLSAYHFQHNGSSGFLKKILCKIKLKLNLHFLLKNNFEFYLRHQLKTPRNLKIVCGLAFGFAKKYPDVHSQSHGGQSVMRKKIDYYLIKK